jgi:uncharacterized membrane protein (DUF485 family)
LHEHSFCVPPGSVAAEAAPGPSSTREFGVSTVHHRPGDGRPPLTETGYTSIQGTPEFAALRSRFRRFVFPMTALFLVWYFLYVLLSSYAPQFMAHKLFGNITTGLVLGLGQFVSTFAITTLYTRWADRSFDTAAAELHDRVLAYPGHNADGGDR